MWEVKNKRTKTRHVRHRTNSLAYMAAFSAYTCGSIKGGLYTSGANSSTEIVFYKIIDVQINR